MKIVIIDNYDSFTFNLHHYLSIVDNVHVDVFRNDQIRVEEIVEYDKIVFSPGPGLPSESPIMFKILDMYAHSKSILGVCLGHQAIVEHYGGHLMQLKEPLHGVQCDVHITNANNSIFKGIIGPIKTGHYHSWMANRISLPDVLDVICEDEQGKVMGVKHKYFSVFGIQFHPESIMTPQGIEILKNWVANC